MARLPTIPAEMLVRREVHYCVSSLVSTLAQSYGGPNHSTVATDCDSLIEQAQDLCYPIEDFEESARCAGWDRVAHSGMFTAPLGQNPKLADYENWQELCEDNDIEPYQWDVFEHWIVSDWLADKLIEHGEKVDKDFAGLTVWARTTTGQAISMDSVIQKITDELNAA